MRRDDTPRTPPTASATVVLQPDHPPELRARITRAQFTAGDPAAMVLVNDDADQVEIAEAAWRILASTGGIVGRSDIAERHAMSRQRVWSLTQNRSFPAAVGEVGGQPVWLTVHVDRYRAQDHRGGRPRKTPEPD